MLVPSINGMQGGYEQIEPRVVILYIAEINRVIAFRKAGQTALRLAYCRTNGVRRASDGS